MLRGISHINSLKEHGRVSKIIPKKLRINFRIVIGLVLLLSVIFIPPWDLAANRYSGNNSKTVLGKTENCQVHITASQR